MGQNQPTALFKTWALPAFTTLQAVFFASVSPSFLLWCQERTTPFPSSGLWQILFPMPCLFPFLFISQSSFTSGYLCLGFSDIFHPTDLGSIQYNFSSVLRTLFSIVVKMRCQQGLLAFACLKMSVLCLHFFEVYFCWIRILRWQLYLSALAVSFCCLLVSFV